jgi:hypothetical protein
MSTGVGNKQVGYVGTTQSIAAFRGAINKFIAPSSPFKGWPRYKDNLGETIPKLPSLEIYPLIIGGDKPVGFHSAAAMAANNEIDEKLAGLHRKQ